MALNSFVDIIENEGLPQDIVIDHVGQAVFDVYGISYGDDEPWEMTDSIAEAIEQCYDLVPEEESTPESRTAHINTEEDVIIAMNNILKW